MRGISAHAAAMHGTMGQIAPVTQKALNPANELTEALNRQKVGMRELMMATRNTNAIWENNQRIMRASGQAFYDAAGNSTVVIDRMGQLGNRTATAGERIRIFNTFLHASSSNLVKWGKNMQWAGRQLTVGFTVPLMFLGRTASNAAEEYDRAMTRVIKVTEFSAEEGTKLLDMQMDSVRRQTDAVMELGAQWGFMAEETVSTVAEFAQMGFIGAELDQLADAALRLSFVTGAELDTSIEATRITAQAFQVDLEDLNEEFARLNIVENNTALSVAESMLGLPVVGAVANAVGMSLQETNGIMAMMKNAGISAKEGATALRTGLLQLVQEATDPTIAAFQKVGLSIEEMKHDMQTLGDGDPLYFFDELQGYIADIGDDQARMNDMASALSKLFGVRQTARILSFMEQFGERMDENSAGGRAWKGVLDETAEVMRIYEFEQRQIEESAAGIAQRLRAELNVELTRLGETFLLVSNRIREVIVSIVRWFNELDERVQKVVMGMGAFMAVLGPLIMLTGLFANAIGNILRIVTRFLPKLTLTNTAQRAQKIAFDEATAAMARSDVMMQRHIATHTAYQKKAAGTAVAARTSGVAVAGRSPTPTVPPPGAGAAAARGAVTQIGRAIVSSILGPIGAVVALIAAVPILANPREFAEGFMDFVGPAIQNIRRTFDGIRDAWQRITELFRQAGSDGEGIGLIAQLMGEIAGVISRGILINLEIILNLLEPILTAIEAIYHFFDAIGNLLSGNEEEFAESLEEAMKAVVRAVVQVIDALLFDIATKFINFLSDFMRDMAFAAAKLPRGERLAEGFYAMSLALEDGAFYMSEFTGEVSSAEQFQRDLNAATETFNTHLQEANDYLDELEDAGVDIGKLTEENVMNNSQLTDEMRAQVLAALRLREIEADRAIMEARIQELRIIQRRNEGTREGFEAEADRIRLQRELLDVLESSGDLVSEYLADMNLQNEALALMGEEVDNVGESFETAEDKLSSFVNRFTGALRGEIRSVMSDVTSAVMQSLSDERDAVMENFRTRLDNIQQEFRARSEALRERIREEQEAFREAHRTRMEQIRERHEREMDRFDERRQAERDAIQEAADARIEALEDEERVETDAERRRERAFEREKARIRFLQGMRTSNIELQLALARGDLGAAAIMREEISSDTAQFHRDAAERERGYVLDDRRRARDAEIEMIRDVTQERLKSFDEQTAAQKEALQEQQEQTIKALEEQNKAQEKALERRHKMMEDSLRKEEDIARRRVEAEQKAAEEGFRARELAIQNTLREWERVNPRTEKEYERHLSQLNSDLRAHSIDWRDVVNNYSLYTGNRIGVGFRTASENAQQAMGEDAKWEQFGEAMIGDLSAGVASGLSDSFKELAEMFGVELPDPADVSQPSYPSNTWSPSGAGSPQQGRLPGQFFHIGGPVRGGGGYRGLKADEVPAVLQSGEYVIQRSAVKSVGSDVLDQINSARLGREDLAYRLHSGGPVDWDSKIARKSTPRGHGALFGRFMSYLAEHGMRPGYGAMDTGSLAHLPNLIPPDRDATWRFPDRGWRHGLHPNVVGITAAILNSIPGGQRITSAFRPGATVEGTNRPSQHGAGLAVDIGALARRDGGSLASEREGDAIAAAFRSHPNVGQVLWKTMVGGNHFNHVHAGFRFHSGGEVEETPDFSSLTMGRGFASGIISKIVGGMFNKIANGFMGGVALDPGMVGAPVASGPVKEYARNMLSHFGWGQDHWAPLYNIVQRESSWNPTAQNPRSTAYGLFQFLDSTWAGVNATKTSDPYSQIRAGLQYIKNRYGSPASAWDFWQRNHWYHSGGQVDIPQLRRGGTVNYDNTVANLHRKETVLTSPLSSKLERGIDMMAAGKAGGDINVYVDNLYGTEENLNRLVDKIEKAQDKRALRHGVKRRMN